MLSRSPYLLSHLAALLIASAAGAQGVMPMPAAPGTLGPNQAPWRDRFGFPRTYNSPRVGYPQFLVDGDGRPLLGRPYYGPDYGNFVPLIYAADEYGPVNYNSLRLLDCGPR